MHKQIISAFLGLLLITSLGAMSLHEAVEKGDYNEVEKIVTTTFDSSDINTKDSHRKTALHLAIQRNDYDDEIVELLLAYGADPNIPDDNNMTPLLCAARELRYGTIPILLCYGADPSLTDNNGENSIEKFKKRMALRTPCHSSELEQYIKEGLNRILNCLISLEAFYQKYTLPNTEDTWAWCYFQQMIAKTCRLNLLKEVVPSKEYLERGEDEYKKSCCSTLIDEPGIILRLIKNDWYNETIIKKCYQYFDTEDNKFKDKPIVCDTILRALRKKERDKKVMGNYHHTNARFAFE